MERSIRAIYDDHTIRVYQAYNASIALPALATGCLVHPFKRDRMTWIKPSYNWMMYRSGCGTKLDQEYILAIDITREGFDWALANAVLSRYHPSIHTSYEQWRHDLVAKPVRVQWDPERNKHLERIEGQFAIQVGLAETAVDHYVDDWIVAIADATPLVRSLSASGGERAFVHPGDMERIYPVHGNLKHLGL